MARGSLNCSQAHLLRSPNRPKECDYDGVPIERAGSSLRAVGLVRLAQRKARNKTPLLPELDVLSRWQVLSCVLYSLTVIDAFDRVDRDVMLIVSKDIKPVLRHSGPFTR